MKNFLEYCQNQKIETMSKNHGQLLYELCLYQNNCADCFDCVKKSCDCNCSKMCNMVDVFKVNEKSFRICGGYENKNNRDFIELGEKLNYKVSFVEILETKEEFVLFEKMEG